MLASVRYYLRGLFRQLYEKDVFLWAQAVGFKVLITLVPIVILATGILGRVIQAERPFRYVEQLIRDFVPLYGADRLVGFLGQLQGASTALTIIGGATLLITATTLFTTLRIVLANIFREDWHQTRSVLRGYAFDLRMAIQVGIFFSLSIGLTVLVQALGPQGLTVLADIGIDSGWLRSVWNGAVQGMSLALPFMVTVGMFFQLLWFTPIPRPPKRSALAGAIVGALLWEAAKSGFTAYATQFGGFDEGFLSVLGDTFVLVILVLFWAYYSGLVLCTGAIVTLLYEARHRNLPIADLASGDNATYPVADMPVDEVLQEPSPEAPETDE